MAAILLLAFLLAAQDKPQKCILSGTVVNSVTGEPLNKVEVRAEAIGSGGGLIPETTTDSKGNFTLVQLEPGEYKLKGIRNGYLDTYYGARRAEGKGTTITLEAGQEVKGLQLKLMPFGVIAGTIRDADGEPVAGANVSVMRQSYSNGRRIIDSSGGADSDDLGQYRIRDLPPGRYYVMAAPNEVQNYDSSRRVDHSAENAERPLALLATLYPGGADFRNARAIEVSAGGRVAGIDITMQRSRVFRVTAHVSAPAGLQIYQPELWLSNGQSGPDSKISGHPANHTGDFQFRDVPPGSYTLIASAGPPDTHQPGVWVWDSDQRNYKGRVPVTVGGADVDDVRVAIGSGTEVTGRIHLEGATTPKLAGHEILFDAGDGKPLAARILDDQAFSTGLYAGRYDVAMKTFEENLVIKSIRSEDGADVLADGLTVADSGRVVLEIVLAPEGGEVDGVALDKDGKPAEGATVLLAPDGRLRWRYRAFKTSTTDQYGRYRFKNTAPGEYTLFAWEDVEEGAWFDPDFLKDFESQGEKVTLPAKGHSAAQLHILADR